MFSYSAINIGVTTLAVDFSGSNAQCIGQLLLGQPLLLAKV